MIHPIVSKTFQVSESDIDELNHVNNQVYVRWLEEAARYASAQNGWSAKEYFENGYAWVVRQHWIEYLRPCFSGDEVTIYTWVSAMSEGRSLRRYALVRNGKLCVTAATEWNLINVKTGRAIPCPDNMAACFEVVPDDDVRLKELKIHRPLRYEPTGL